MYFLNFEEVRKLKGVNLESAGRRSKSVRGLHHFNHLDPFVYHFKSRCGENVT